MDIMTRLPGVNYPDLPFRPITGRYLAHAKLTHAEWAFIGADLVTGQRQLVYPTIIQAANLAHGVNRSAVQWALQRLNERTAIEAGVIPLAVRPLKALPAPMSAEQRLKDLATEMGVAEALEVLVKIELALAA